MRPPQTINDAMQAYFSGKATPLHLETIEAWLREDPAHVRFFVDLLREKAIPVGLNEVIFDASAAHTWPWTDRFQTHFLERALDSSDPSSTEKDLS